LGYGWAFAVSEAFEIIGLPTANGILIVADHASNQVPAGIDLGLPPADLDKHIAWDIGVAEVAQIMVGDTQFSGILASCSRLVVDLNREAGEAAVIPLSSDGIEITGNRLDNAARQQRLDRYFHPYHSELARLIAEYQPALLLSLHSFTPSLESRPDEQRPWEIGVLYNEDDRAARIAIPMLQQAGFIVGDQLPYSGKKLNATMNRHGEGTGTAYLGIEMRQDLSGNIEGQARFAAILTEICHKVIETLGAATQKQ
jgi:predicted N-formylglutamate amidohydrolase